MDTNRVEAQFADGSAVAIDCIAIEGVRQHPGTAGRTGLAAVEQALGVRTDGAERRDGALSFSRL